MPRSLTVDGTAYSYEAEPEAGVVISSGERWHGTSVKWRPGTKGRWHRFNLVDVHPFDLPAVEQALRAVVRGEVRGAS